MAELADAQASGACGETRGGSNPLPPSSFHAFHTMKIETYTKELRTRGQNDCVDITSIVQETLGRSQLRQGIVTIFVTGSTAGVTTIEHEPGLVNDLKEALKRLFPENLPYAHHQSGDDDNGFSH